MNFRLALLKAAFSRNPSNVCSKIHLEAGYDGTPLITSDARLTGEQMREIEASFNKLFPAP